MEKFKSLKIKLHSLVIFRSFLEKKTIKNLLKLLSCETSDIEKIVDCYSSFALSLFLHSDNLSEYVLKYMIEDENIYMKACCKSEEISEILQNSLKNELEILSQISSLSSKEITGEINYKGFLVSWNNTEYDLNKIYKERIKNLHKNGFGVYSRYHAFVLKDGKITAVKHPDTQKMSELFGYELERKRVIDNTLSLLNGKTASNVLLYGDAGTGKSSTVKAICNEYKDRGLRLLEVKKNQLYQIPDIIDKLSANPLKFIIFIDDLSFSSNDNDFAALKAILEGSVGGKSSNIVVYATSNRRHLVKENFSDREGDEIHLGDTIQELMSLSARFGLKVSFSKPNKDLFSDIVFKLADLYDIDMPQDELLIKAEAHALRNGGRNPRLAKQFIEQLKNL